MSKRKGAEDEEAFPRGKPAPIPGSTGSRADGDSQPRPDSAPAAHQKRPRGESKPTKEEAGGEDGDEAAATLEDPTLDVRIAPRLRHADLVEGTLLVAAVREANDEEIVLNLPYNLVAYASLAHATEPTKVTGVLPKLPVFYRPGQLVVVVITKVVEIGGGNSKRQRIEVSLRPSLINAGLDADSLVPQMWLPAAVQDEEEHVIRLNFGVGNLQGVLQKSEVADLPYTLCPGMIIQVAAQAVNIAARTVRCTTKTSKSLGSEQLKMDTLKAGFLVHARVDKILKGSAPTKSSSSTADPEGGIQNRGLVVSFCGALNGVIHVHHQGLGSTESLPIKQKQRITARVLAVVQGASQVSVHLSVLPHILDWAPTPEVLLASEVGDRLEAEVLDVLPKYGCRLRCSRKGVGGTFLPGFCPSGRFSDKGVEDAEAPAINSKVSCRVLGYNFLDSALVITQRPYDLHEDTLVAVSELSVGQMVVGTITRVADYGVFLKLSEYVTGLVHLRQLTDVPLAKVPKKFQEGAKVKCRVLRVMAEKKQVSLTAKKALVRDTFQFMEFEQAQNNMIVTGYVNNVKPFGAIVTFYGDVYGLIPTKEMVAEEAPALGMAVTCRISAVDRKKKKLILSLDLTDGKQPSELPAIAPKFNNAAAGALPGDTITTVELVKCTDEGAFVSFNLQRSGGDGERFQGFVPVAHLSDSLELAKTCLGSLAASKAGASTTLIEGVVLAKRFSAKRSSASSKAQNDELSWVVLVSFKPSLLLAARDGAFLTEFSQLEESKLYAGYVKEVRDFGAVVSIGAWRISGVAPKHQIADHFVETPSSELSPGQSLRVLISKIDAEHNRFSADLRPTPATSADAPLLKREAEALRLYFESRKALASNKDAKKLPSIQPGTVLEGEVASLESYGALLNLPAHDGVQALALTENFATKPQVGEIVSCMVLDVNSESGIIDVSLRQELTAGPSEEPVEGTSSKKKRKPKKTAEDLLVEGRQVMVLPALSKPTYSVLWCKEPPAVVFAPPFGDRKWSQPRSVMLHSVEPGQTHGFIIARCPLGGGEARDRPKVPKILKPEEELQVGAPVTMRIQSISGQEVVCVAPVGLRGHLHSTHFVNTGGKLGSGGQQPLEDLQVRGIVEARVMHMKQFGSGPKGKLFDLELTCRPSLLQPRDASDYEGARVTWSNLKSGMHLPGAVVEVRRNFMWLEVAHGIRGRVGLLDASRDMSVMKNLGDHFQEGQVFEAKVVRVDKSQKKLDLALQGSGTDETPDGGHATLARLERIEEVGGHGIAATFQLPNRRRGFAHITELFDFWAQFPLKRLKPGHIYEAFVLKRDAAKDADGKTTKDAITLRSSLVHGRAEGPEERRPMIAGDLKVGQKVSGYVVTSGPKGVFVALSRTLVARIKLRFLSDSIVSKDAVSQLHPAGELIRDATVVEVNEEKGFVELSLRTGDSKGRLTIEQLAVGDVVAGRVKAVEKFGIFITFDNSRVDGLIHKTEVSDTASVSLDSYKSGDKIPRAKILKIDGRKISLGIKASLFEDDLEEDDDDEDIDMDEIEDKVETKKKPADSGNAADTSAGSAADVEAEFTKEEIKKKKRKTPEVTKVATPAVESDDETPWGRAAEAERSTADTAKGSDAAFEWADLKDANRSDSDEGEEDGGDDEKEGSSRPSKRQKKAAKTAEAEELRKREAENAEGEWANNPRSVEDFERLLLSKGDTSIVWIRYMAFHLKMSDLVRARQVAERSVKHVGFSEAKERFNAWVAYLNLECTFGTEETAEALFKRAASHNEAKHMHLQLAKIHQRNKKPELATKAFQTCCIKFAQSKKVWLGFITFLYEQGDLEGGRKTLPKCLAALPRKKHPVVVSKAALLEYQHGNAERGQSVFEGLLDSYPKRTDLWSIYIDAHIGANTPPKAAAVDLQPVRSLMERCCALRLKAAKMRFFFKKWLIFETRWGDVESQERVRSLAREFVEAQGA